MKPNSTKPIRLLGVEEFCRAYGLARSSIYKLAKSRQIPVITIGPRRRGIKLDPVKVLAALERPAVKTKGQGR